MNDPRLYLKPGVDLNGLTPAGARILAVVAVAPLILGFPITITCGREGHGPADPHTIGSALDLRTVDLTAVQVLALMKYCTGQLGTAFFTTLYEVPSRERAGIDPTLVDFIYSASDPDEQHLHLQRKIGTTYPATGQSV